MTAKDPRSPTIHIRHAPDAGRYEIRLGRKLVGFTEYRDRVGRRIFVHTETDPDYAGRGLGSRLIRFALDDTRAAGMRIIPRCPFVRAFIERHREYAAPEGESVSE